MKTVCFGFVVLIGAAVAVASCGGEDEGGTPAAVGGSAGTGLGGGAGAAGTSAGGSGTGGGGGSSAGPSLDELAPLLAQVYCDTLKSCAGPMFDIYLGGQDCKAMLQPGVEDRTIAGLKAAVAAGTVVYQSDKVQACLEALKAEACALPTTRIPAICEEALKGSVAVGGDCSQTAECVGDAYCKGDTCPGKCSALEAAGAACTTDDACQSGLKCVGKKCFKPLGAGATCNNGDECSIGFFCLGADEAKAKTGQCKAQTELFVAKENETCDFANGPLCEASLACVVESFTLPSTVVLKCVKQSASGGACKAGGPDPCPAGQYCSGTDVEKAKFDGTCAPSPGDGQPCAVLFGTHCATGAVCDDKTVCRVPQRIGGVCVNNKACYSELCEAGLCVMGKACGVGTP